MISVSDSDALFTALPFLVENEGWCVLYALRTSSDYVGTGFSLFPFQALDPAGVDGSASRIFG